MSKKKILFVDDEPDVREALSDLFETFGYEVYTAASGNKALEILKKQHMDIVISDVKMPDGDGVFLLTELRKVDPTTPVVIMITGFSEITKDEAMNKGANGFFQKPFDFSTLRKEIERQLAGQK